jgi:hypothetical protein
LDMWTWKRASALSLRSWLRPWRRCRRPWRRGHACQRKNPSRTSRGDEHGGGARARGGRRARTKQRTMLRWRRGRAAGQRRHGRGRTCGRWTESLTKDGGGRRLTT